MPFFTVDDDEGFASVERAIADGVSSTVDQLVESFSDGPLPGLAVDVYSGQGLAPGKWDQHMGEQAESWSLREKVLWSLDWFAYTLASQLLGDGYGTGNYSLRGRFRVDLPTGKLNDVMGE